MDNDRLIATNEQVDDSAETKIRPQELDSFIGQPQVRENLRVFVDAARGRNEAMDHVLLHGPPGLGKTTLAQIIARELGVGFRATSGPVIAKAGDLAAILTNLQMHDVLFIDEMHTMVGAGAAEGAVDAANILKPSLARGELQCIGATTLDDYRKYIERDPALERRFQPVNVKEPSTEETTEILRGIKKRYEEHHELEITDEAIQAAAALATRYIPDRFLPDKAIDLIDEASSKAVSYTHLTLPTSDLV